MSKQTNLKTGTEEEVTVLSSSFRLLAALGVNFDPNLDHTSNLAISQASQQSYHRVSLAGSKDESQMLPADPRHPATIREKQATKRVCIVAYVANCRVAPLDYIYTDGVSIKRDEGYLCETWK